MRDGVDRERDKRCGQAAGTGAQRLSLLNAERVSGTAVLLDRLSLSAGGHMGLAVPSTSVTFLQGLEGLAKDTIRPLTQRIG